MHALQNSCLYSHGPQKDRVGTMIPVYPPPPPRQPCYIYRGCNNELDTQALQNSCLYSYGSQIHRRDTVILVSDPPTPPPTLLHLQAVGGGGGVYTNELDVQALLNSCTYSHGSHRVCDTFSMHSTPADSHMALTLLSLSCHTGSGSCSNVTRFTPHSLNQ